jgi:hypothetical protein
MRKSTYYTCTSVDENASYEGIYKLWESRSEPITKIQYPELYILFENFQKLSNIGLLFLLSSKKVVMLMFKEGERVSYLFCPAKMLLQKVQDAICRAGVYHPICMCWIYRI